MKKSLCLLLLLPMVLGALNYQPKQLIVQTTTPKQITRGSLGIPELESYLAQYQINDIKAIIPKADNRFYLIQTNMEIDFEAVKDFRFAGIETIQPNFINDFYLEPDDPLFESQRVHYENVNVTQTWNYTTGNEEIVVAIVDSGMRFDHPDLQENIYYNTLEIPDDGIDNDGNGYIDDYRGWDFVDAPELSNIGIGDYTEQDNDPTDEINHGTHIAGIIGATANNQTGVAGLVWNTKMMIVRAGFNSRLGGFLQDDDAAAAVIYAADMGADVISISWGDVAYSAIIDYAINYAYQKGTIVVCASGNEGSKPGHPITYPAKFANTISVGAVDNQKHLASFSSYGADLDVVAPGQQITSTYDSEGENIYYEQSGTSMAAPFVSSAVALLLSAEPELEFEQVRSRLLTTAEDLGAVGYDNEYGFGLLDTYKMLTCDIAPEVIISYPGDYTGFSESFDIYGTASVVPAEDFFRYFVMYSHEENPGSNDWYNIDPSEELYHYSPVEDGYLGTFVLENLMPAAEYKIKLEVVTSDHQHYSTIHHINIDQTAPVWDHSRSYVMERYYNEQNRFYMGAVYDDKINLEVTDANSGTKYYGSSPDSLQILQIPTTLSGITTLDLKATNLSGLETEDSSAYQFDASSKTIETNSWEQNLLSKQLVSIRTTKDFDENGLDEIVAIEVQADSTRIVKAFEVVGSELVEKHIFPFGSFFWPYDIGSMELGKTHLLGVAIDNAVVYEASPGSDYPDVSIASISDCYGGRFVDVDDNGVSEIALSRNIKVNEINHKVITITRMWANEITDIDTLWNWSPTSSINAFTNQIEAADFDSDGTPEVLTADGDGDVMLFRNGEPIWGARMPVGNVDNMAIGDFDDDGDIDFCVGGYNFNSADAAKSFSYFGFFSYSDTLGSFIEFGSISFDNLEERNSLVAVDIDGDGGDEAIILASPNLYVVDYQDDEIVPIWNGPSTNTFKNVLVALPEQNGHSAMIISPIMENSERKSVIFTPAAPFYGPDTPTGFTAAPSDSTTALLSWDPNDYDHVIIYRKFDGEVVQVATTISTTYLDDQLSPNQTYQYSIAGVDSDFTPEISKSTLWKEITTSAIPHLISVVMCSPYELKINFDQTLHNNSINVQHFNVNNDIGIPVSANLINMKKGLLLSFDQIFPELDDFVLHINGLQGETGIYLPDQEHGFIYQEDTTPPEINYTTTVDKQNVRIYFSETMQEALLEEINNYQLVLPIIDSGNTISVLNSGNDEVGNYVELTFSEDLKYTNQSYFIKLKNLKDLAGNTISNDGNKSSFVLTEIVDLKHMIVYPNPLYLNKFNEIRFANLPLKKSGSIQIYDLAGDLVYSQDIEPLTELKNYFGWNAINNKGKRVSSGMYLYYIKVGNDFKKGKLAVIH